MNDLAAMLAGGQRKELGRVPEAVEAVLTDAEPMAELMTALLCDDLVVRGRAAVVLRRVVEAEPQRAEPHRAQLFGPILAVDQWEVRNEICHILPLLAPAAAELPAIVDWLADCRKDKSGIVRAWSLNALYELSKIHPHLAGAVSERLAHALESGTPAERARARHILADMEK